MYVGRHQWLVVCHVKFLMIATWNCHFSCSSLLCFEYLGEDADQWSCSSIGPLAWMTKLAAMIYCSRISTWHTNIEYYIVSTRSAFFHNIFPLMLHQINFCYHKFRRTTVCINCKLTPVYILPMMIFLGPTRVLGRFSERATTVILYCCPMMQLDMMHSVLLASQSTVP